MQILEFEQCSPEWYQARLGLPTASEFHTVLAKGRDGGASVTRKTYMRKLAGEIITGEPMENYSNGHMERGKAMEDEARANYCFMHDVEPIKVGFILSDDGKKGCSPDSLIGEDGAIEIKTALPHILGELIEKDQFPPEHKAQTQGILWIAKREWIDLTVYWPKMPRFVKRAQRDEAYIAKLSSEVDRFSTELHDLVERIRRYGAERAAA